jgi:predicted permease
MGREAYLQNFIQDIRYSLRFMSNNPAFTLVAIITLALGIGANSAIFSLVNGILLRPLPYPAPDRLVSLTETYPKGAFVIARDTFETMDVAAVWAGEEFNLTSPGRQPVRLNGSLVSAEFFSVLGVNPELGRAFHSGEDISGNDNVVILSHALWQSQFGGEPNVLGSSITLEGQTRQVVGVMPADFGNPSPETHLWVPLKLDSKAINEYWGPEMPLFGRLRPEAGSGDAALALVNQEIKMLIPMTLASCPFPRPPNWNRNSVAVSLQQSLVGDVRTKLLILLGAVGLVLLMACANVANLLLARSVARRKEIAVRASLGAVRGRIVRQLLTESLLLALAGGILGLVLATQGLLLLKSLLPAHTPRLAEVSMDWRVVGFTAALAIVTGLVFGIAPALTSSRVNLLEALNTGWRRSSGGTGQLDRILVVLEMGLAVVLVIGAGLLIKSLWILSRTNPGFNMENILTLQVSPDKNFCKDRGPCITFYDELLRQARALPGIEKVAAVNAVPLSDSYPVVPLTVDGYHPGEGEAQSPLVWAGATTPGYTELMGIPLLEGRDFTDDDRADTAGVVIVTASTARIFWPGQDPLGKRLKLVWEKDWRSVVGVAGDVKQYGLNQRRPDYLTGEMYMPFTQAVTGRRSFPVPMVLVIRATGDRLPIGNEVRDLVNSLNGDVPVSPVRSMGDLVAASISTSSSTTWLFGTFSLVALVLGMVGIYSLISYAVIERTHEVGVRMALGARREDVLRLIVKQGMGLTVIGIALGLAAALGLTRLMSGLLYEVHPIDITIYTLVPIVLLIVALLATYIPARRATKVDPIVALRFE